MPDPSKVTKLGLYRGSRVAGFFGSVGYNYELVAIGDDEDVLWSQAWDDLRARSSSEDNPRLLCFEQTGAYLIQELTYVDASTAGGEVQ